MKKIKFSLLLVLIVLAMNLSAATEVYVENNSDLEFAVTALEVSGDALSKKAWKRGENLIPAGKRIKVLSINRTGKFNWMDPTPRFIEPGKTAIFTIQISDTTSKQSVVIKQKLLGTGSGSRLWYSMEIADESQDWLSPYEEANHTPSSDSTEKRQFTYRALKTDKDDHLELLIHE